MKKLLFGIIFCLPVGSWAEGERVVIAHFSQGNMNDWQTKVFAGKTQYSLQNSHGKLALRADSRSAASGKYREINIDLSRSPMLNWTWKIDNIWAGVDERTRAGDDFVARVYVVFSGGLAFWRTRAINYVWSSNQPVGSSWHSAYTDNIRMIAVESGNRRINQWVSEQQNVYADYQRLFGEEPNNISAVAIMTDTDNTGLMATAWYGDIWFAAE